MSNLVAHALEPFVLAEGNIEVHEGPNVRVLPRAALAITLAIHELVTNAIKYGALSVPMGRVRLSWTVENDSLLVVSWKESGGPAVQAPTRKGFGTALIERGLAGDLHGSAKLDYRPDGVVCTLTCTISASFSS